MQIRSEDIQAIVTSVEWLVEGGLSEIRIRRDGETIFAARLNGDALQIDPQVMPPELAQRLLEDTDLLGGGSESSGESKSDRASESRGRSATPKGGANASGRAAKAKARV